MTVTIAELNLFPIKGCRGVSLRSATLAATGLEHDGIGDREWVIVDGEGEFLSQRELPRMALIETRFVGESLRLRAPGMLTLEVPFASVGDVVNVRVWDDTVAAVTQGEIADAWCSQFLGRRARLMRFDPEGERLAAVKYTGKYESPYKFADGFPLLITNTASLVALNRRLKSAVTMNRFRANLVLDGIDAFEEDYVRELRVAGMRLRPVKSCARCTVPGVDPETGEASTDVPDALAAFRGTRDGVMFGVNAIVIEGAGGTLTVGDSVEVELNV